MTIWVDPTTGKLYDDMNGAALLMPSWLPGLVLATPAEINPPTTIDQVRTLLETETQNYLDNKARARGYDSAASCISYLTSGNTVWQAEAAAMLAWRDAVWSYCIANATSVTTSTTWAQLQPLLPLAPW